MRALRAAVGLAPRRHVGPPAFRRLGHGATLPPAAAHPSASRHAPRAASVSPTVGSLGAFHSTTDARSRPSASAADSPAATPLLRECIGDYSIEVTPGAAKKIDSFADVALLAPGTTVNVTYLVGADIDESISICARLVDGGMRPVAHVPARAFVTMGDAEDFSSSWCWRRRRPRPRRRCPAARRRAPRDNADP